MSIFQLHVVSFESKLYLHLDNGNEHQMNYCKHEVEITCDFEYSKQDVTHKIDYIIHEVNYIIQEVVYVTHKVDYVTYEIDYLIHCMLMFTCISLN